MNDLLKIERSLNIQAQIFHEYQPHILDLFPKEKLIFGKTFNDFIKSINLNNALKILGDKYTLKELEKAYDFYVGLQTGILSNNDHQELLKGYNIGLYDEILKYLFVGTIAFDAVSSGGNEPGGSFTFSHTCTGSNIILIVGISASNLDVITGVTYNGVAMTLAKKSATSSPTMYLFYLLNPATGANTVSVTASGSGEYLRAVSVSYTGIQQSGQPDATAENKATATSVTTSLTQIVLNAWQVGLAMADGQVVTAGAGVNAVRGNRSSVTYMGDSNGNTSPGTQTLTWNTTPSIQMSALQFSLADIDQSAPGGLLKAVEI